MTFCLTLLRPFRMMMADAKPKSSRGRKPTLTDSGRKRKKKETNALINRSRVYVGEQYNRWNELKTTLRLQTHSEVAKVLLDRYDQSEKDTELPVKQKSNAVVATPDLTAKHGLTSTPGPSHQHSVQIPIDVSEISNTDTDSDGAISGIQALPTKRPRKEKSKLSSSFLDPFELSIIDISESESQNESHRSDEDYDPSFNITIRPNNDDFDSLKICSGVNDDGSDDDDDDDDDDIMEEGGVDPGPDLIKITSINPEKLTSDQPFLVYYQCLMQLIDICIQGKCKECGSDVDLTKNIIGSALHLKWTCRKGHVIKKWCSQPILNRRMHSGDLMFASAVLLSGNNFQKISLFAKFLNLPAISSTTFHKIQRTYLIPSIDDFWLEKQEETINLFRGQELVILGDGRMDSPGHSAQYCSYTFMEYTTKKILCIITMDKRMTDLKSTNLEKSCFVKGLQFLLNRGLKVVEVVTDAHVQVASIMKKDYPNICHSFDIWHGTKNLGKKIMSIGQESNKKELLPWTKDIMNHFWHAAQVSDTYETFIGIWFGLLHHVTDEHEWILSYSDNGINACQHGPLTEERTKGWLKKDSPAHIALRHVVMDKRRLNQIHYYLNCRSTAELENFQNLILVYASKRYSYGPPTYRARNRLAALDHNGHLERETKINKDGSVRYQRSFNKKSGIWSVHELKEDKTYNYIQSLVEKIVRRRLDDEEGMSGNVVLEADDPRRISKTLARIPPPPTAQLVKERKSRFEDPDKTLDYSWDS
ncbi:uncharacterized protein LOC128188330 [Crassostrea angulata]|uniref:uncharacterized protein LOC128188330 n=1 Tax=Magallana angulata TaxID=2784310 RepID=UPI0022B0E4C3|nr:uncharacterized protein LOC128188330 [Crassostrea angulata]